MIRCDCCDDEMGEIVCPKCQVKEKESLIKEYEKDLESLKTLYQTRSKEYEKLKLEKSELLDNIQNLQCKNKIFGELIKFTVVIVAGLIALKLGIKV